MGQLDVGHSGFIDTAHSHDDLLAMYPAGSIRWGLGIADAAGRSHVLDRVNKNWLDRLGDNGAEMRATVCIVDNETDETLFQGEFPEGTIVARVRTWLEALFSRTLAPGMTAFVYTDVPDDGRFFNPENRDPYL